MLIKKIFLNTAVNSAGKFLSFAFQIFIITYLIKTLGKDAYGMVVLALALVANTNLLEAGFGLSVTKYVAEYKAKGDMERLLRIVNTNLVVSTVFGLALCVILLVINEFFLERIFTVPADFLSSMKNLIRVLIPLSILEFWSVSLIRVAEGFQRYTLARSMELIKWFLRAAFVFVSVSMGYGILGVGVAYFAAGLISLGIVYIKVILLDPELRLALSLSDRESFSKLFSFSIWIFLSKVFAFFSYRIDTILIGIFLPPANLTYYNVAFKVYEFFTYGITLISSTLVPMASELEAAGDRRRLSMLFERATRYTVLCISPCIVIAMAQMPGIMHLWMGAGFELSVLLARLFLTALIPMMLITSGAAIMVGMNRVKELVKYNAVATAVNFALSVYLVSRIGAPGVVIGTLSGSFVILVSYVFVMIGIFGIPFAAYIRGIVIKPLAALAVMVALVFFLPGIAGVLTGFTVYLAFTVFIVVDRDDLKGLIMSVKSLFQH